MREMTGLNELLRQGRMTWMEPEHGWVAAPEAILTALVKDGFEEGTVSGRQWAPAPTPDGDNTGGNRWMLREHATSCPRRRRDAFAGR